MTDNESNRLSPNELAFIALTNEYCQAIETAYDHDRNTKNRDELLMARFTEADILAGEIVTESSFLKRVVFQEKGGTTR